MTMTTKRERDAERAHRFLEEIDWTGEFHPHPEMDEGAIDRFWSKFRLEDGHWIWTRSTTMKGAGQFAIHAGSILKTHRLAWMLTRGEIEPGLVLSRKDSCDRAECGNPDHYVKHTDAEAKALGGRTGGRGNFKSRPRSIPVNCSQDAVNLLMAMHEQGRPIRELYSFGQRLSLGPATIQHIIKGNARGVR